jgi:1-acyl-sn-glycerol-3-phosphate acyltransferase
MYTFPTRTLRCAVAEVLFKKNFLMVLFLKLMGTIRVDRDIHDFSFLGKCKNILSRGGVVEIYPESRLPEPDEERPLEFKTSAVYLALESGVPIIPICNNAQYFTKNPLRVMIGKPIDVRALYRDDLSEKENIESINAYVRGKIIEYRNQIRLIDEGNQK